jgi:hypothetical protein
VSRHNNDDFVSQRLGRETTAATVRQATVERNRAGRRLAQLNRHNGHALFWGMKLDLNVTLGRTDDPRTAKLHVGTGMPEADGSMVGPPAKFGDQVSDRYDGGLRVGATHNNSPAP